MSSDAPLLRWGIENSDAEALKKSVQEGQAKTFDPELIEAILGRDDPVTMRDFVGVVVNEEASEEERCQAYELLIDLVAQIDNANNVAKMGFWQQLLPLLDSPIESLRVNTLWMVAACSQNNSEAAQYLTSQDVLGRIIRRAYGPVASVQEARKLVSACSAIFQSADDGFSTFTRLSGLDLFADLLEKYDDANLKLRLMHSLDFICQLLECEPEALKSHPTLYPALQEYQSTSEE